MRELRALGQKDLKFVLIKLPANVLKKNGKPLILLSWFDC